jgi:hypothetical protein
MRERLDISKLTPLGDGILRTAAMILSGSFGQMKGFGLALVSAMKLWMASLSSWRGKEAPRLRRRLDKSVNNPSTALSQDAEVGVK